MGWIPKKIVVSHLSPPNASWCSQKWPRDCAGGMGKVLVRYKSV